MSLYRTYRPQSFADVVGQEHVITTLENAALQQKLAHAFLFAGSRGTGKTSVARILAKALMTHSIADDVLRKQIAKGVEEGTIVDLLEIDAASNRGIDDVRDLIEKIQFSPVVAGAKVYIIDEVHMLTKEAFNALLKTLEEPPPYAYFILATTELHKIPMTIRSRCQCFPFRAIREEEIVRRLQYIADQERITIDREALRAIAHHVQGGMRDAISLLDQLRTLPSVTRADVEERIGTTGHEYIESLWTALEEEDGQKIVEIVRTVEEAGIPLDVFLRQLLAATREDLHAAVRNGQSTDTCLIRLQTLLSAIKDVRIAPVPGLVVESALLSLCGDGAKPRTMFEALLPKSTPKEKKPKNQEPKEERKETKGEKNDEPVKSEPKKESIVEAPELTMESLRSHWPAIVNQTTPPSVKMSLKNGAIRLIEEQRVVVQFESSFHRDKVAETHASRGIEEIMEKIFRRKMRLECTLEDEKKTRDAAEDPVDIAEAAMEIF